MKKHRHLCILCALCGFELFSPSAARRAQAQEAATQPALLPYQDLSRPFDQRVADLVGRMTLEEKAQQMQMYVPENMRLGIPACNWWSEAIHGVGRAGAATVFPEAIGMAATWDPALVKKIADAIGDEARAKYVPDGSRYRGLMLWCPTVNMARDPRWGRVEETYGEDPYLAGRIGVAFVQGLQGDDPKYLKAVATPKHLAMYSQESGRMSRSYDISESLLRDYYLPAFEACFVEGKAASTMAAHNGINDVPCTANSWLLTDVLRGEWKFQGAVVTDWTAVTALVRSRGYAATEVEAAADAINAGVDVICDRQSYAYPILEAVRTKQLKVETLDRAVSRNLLVRFRLGVMDPPEKVPFTRLEGGEPGSAEHTALALQASRESIVLLKNDAAPRGYGFERLLPLDLRRIDSIAVLGPYAAIRQYGNYSGIPYNYAPTILESLRVAVGDRVKINTADWGDSETALRAAASSTVAVVVLGLNNQMEFEGIDRSSLELSGDQTRFLTRLVAANPLTVVVLEGGSAIGVEWMKAHVPAVLMIWYPGEQGANALSEVLFGQCNPSGRLPLTFYRSVQDLPPLSDYDITKGRTYMYANLPPSYPFGFGLSYTTFAYDNLKIEPPAASAGQSVEIAVDIANTGTRDGDEVVQLYERKPQSSQPRPKEQLKRFQRAVTIPAGQTRTVKLTLAVDDLGMWDEKAHKYVVEPGRYEILIGSSSADIRRRAMLQIR